MKLQTENLARTLFIWYLAAIAIIAAVFIAIGQVFKP